MTTTRLNRCGLITAHGTALGLRTSYAGLDFLENLMNKGAYRARLRARSLEEGVELFLAGDHWTDLAWEVRGYLKGHAEAAGISLGC
jgi:hypothetical protein